MDARIIRISFAENWPGITPANVGRLKLSQWMGLMLALDEITDERRKQREKLKPKKRGGR